MGYRANSFDGRRQTEQEVDEYHEILVAKNIFEQKTHNPSAEDRGTIEKLEVPSSVSDDLCKEIVEMVKAISENEVSFDFKAWNRKWETASKVGD